MAQLQTKVTLGTTDWPGGLWREGTDYCAGRTGLSAHETEQKVLGFSGLQSGKIPWPPLL